MINSDRWARIEEIYHAALLLRQAERESFLLKQCDSDIDLRREVELLLSAHESSGDFLVEPVFDARMNVLVDQSAIPTEIFSETEGDTFALIGTTLAGRYYIERKLAPGGIGNVYLARDKPELMSRPVVVKVLQEEFLRNEWIVTKFRQEIEALTRIDDPGVVGLIDAGTLQNGHPYLVMQFVEGQNLRALLRPGVGMEFDEVASIIGQVGRALTAAHEEDVIHRDLKPENIMVRRRSDNSLQVRVIDFGIAKVRNSQVAPSTVNNMIAGTYRYMSPEQLLGRKVFAQSDVYSLGVIAYEMCTGSRPFNPENQFELPKMHQVGVQVMPQTLRPGISRSAQNTILKALSLEPSDRHQRAIDFSSELSRALLEEEEHIARPVMSVPTLPAIEVGPLREREVRSTRRNVLLPIIAIAAFLVVGLIGVFAWQLAFSKRGPSRSITYWLTVQRMHDGKTIGQAFEATGKSYFHTGDKFSLNITTTDAGALYVVNEGLDQSGQKEWNILFPTRNNNVGVPSLDSKQSIKTGDYYFTGNTGVETVWVVWATEPDSTLNDIFRDALSDGVIRKQDHLAQLQQFLKEHDETSTELIEDEEAGRSVLKGNGNVIVKKLAFAHKPN